MWVVVVQHGALVAQIIRRRCHVVAATAAGGGCRETAHHPRPAHEEQEDRADEDIHWSFSSAPPPPPRPHVLLVGSSSSYHGLRAGDHSDLFNSILPESRWHKICGDVQRKGELEGYVGGGGTMANPRFKEHYLGPRVLAGNKCSSRIVHAPRAAYFMNDGRRHGPSRRSFSSSAASSPSGTPATSPPTTSPSTTSPPATSTAPPAPAVSVPATTSPPASTGTHAAPAVSAPPPPSTSPDPQPLCSEATDRCLLGDWLDTFYDPVEFVRHFPAVMFSQPMNAPDTLYDRWVFKDWFQYAVRDSLGKLHDHHLVGLEFEEISVKNMTIACNIGSSEFYPKFNFDGKIRKSTSEGQKKNYTQLGNALEQLINISAGATSLNAYHYQLLTDDAKDLLYKLKHPTLDPYEAYMLRNHPSLLQIEAHAAFYLTCFDHLKQLPKQPAELVFNKLPYAIGDRDGHWIAIAQQHPLLSEQLSYGYGISNWFQVKYRRDGYCHRTHLGSRYSIVGTHRIGEYW